MWDNPSSRGGQIVTVNPPALCSLISLLEQAVYVTAHCSSFHFRYLNCDRNRMWLDAGVRILFIEKNSESSMRSHILPVILFGASFWNGHNGSLFGLGPSPIEEGTVWAFKKCLLSEPSICHAYLQIRLFSLYFPTATLKEADSGELFSLSSSETITEHIPYARHFTRNREDTLDLDRASPLVSFHSLCKTDVYTTDHNVRPVGKDKLLLKWACCQSRGCKVTRNSQKVSPSKVVFKLRMRSILVSRE